MPGRSQPQTSLRRLRKSTEQRTARACVLAQDHGALYCAPVRHGVTDPKLVEDAVRLQERLDWVQERIVQRLCVPDDENALAGDTCALHCARGARPIVGIPCRRHLGRHAAAGLTSRWRAADDARALQRIRHAVVIRGKSSAARLRHSESKTKVLRSARRWKRSG